MQQDKKGFSFIELLIVVVIVVTVIREVVILNFF
jgi:prepilin-type N-terminal cleavage/methylation domain-containing protein